MNLSLHLVEQDDLLVIGTDIPGMEGIVLAPGALPPPVLIELAARNVALGMEPLWNSFFLLIVGQPKRAIGSGGFRGSPRAGRVEIGYGVAEEFRCQGAATSAVLMLLDRAFASVEVCEVFAETSVANAASRRVVEKAGFLHMGSRMSAEDGKLDQWLCTRKEPPGSCIELPSSMAERHR